MRNRFKHEATYRGIRFLVVGAGTSGRAVSQVLATLEGSVTLTDRDERLREDEGLKRLADRGVRFEWGPHREETFLSADCIVVSPGVPLTLDPIQKASEAGIPVLGEVEVASTLLKGKIVAVTGTNGKSTTTSLIGKILEGCYDSVFTGGNLGRPLSEAFLQKRQWDILVLEMSSFQLEAIQSFHPSVGVLLNLTPDHLDRYNTFEDYVAAKGRLFLNMGENDLAVVNGEDDRVMQMAGKLSCSVVTFQKSPGDLKCVFLNGEKIVSNFHGEPVTVLDLNELAGGLSYPVDNALAATAATLRLGCPAEEIRRGLKAFTGLPHRMERVRKYKEILFINDSKGTNVGALRGSLESVSSPVILIAGGRYKGGDFGLLNVLVREKVRHLVLLGEAAPKLEETWGGLVPTTRVSSLPEGVQQAWVLSRPGDTVLLSPGCASFDMFKNFEERGSVFKEAVWNL